MLTTPGTFMGRLKILTTPVKDQVLQNVNGVTTEPAQVRLTNTEGEEVWMIKSRFSIYYV